MRFVPPVFFLLLLQGLLLACNDAPPVVHTKLEKPRAPYRVSAMDGDALNVIIEIPAGTNHKIEYDSETGFSNDTLEGGITRVINFLPYPGNYGFVPSTLMDRAQGGDGDPLDVLVICESLATGSRIAVKPIATLLLLDRGEIDTKIIAVPADTNLRVFKVDNFLDFALENDAAKSIIESWFLNYKGPRVTELLRWEDEMYAWREVRKWTLPDPDAEQSVPQ
ncbi:inorganic diphosphatase [Neolewinella lacunae]|uniref:inorganic diphosphatase n=1 Tax=Neolewinella lacunae TaxID=1517758 RepID=A0A923T7L4_9BACT|nr:inorganic diphosphatase [Neolewinella lacunae]MBC6992998.1 inorganic diphosphatase [Neolewinella lacunae]MDN3635788.1 inorganic diphosphatase [Neolewinella lacunae]